MDKIRELLDEEIKREIEQMSLISPGEEGYKDATERLDKLYQRRIDEIKLGSEESFKTKQLLENKKDRYIKLAVDGAGILLPLWFYAVWMRRGFRFEETGCFTSTTFKGLFNRFRPMR